MWLGQLRGIDVTRRILVRWWFRVTVIESPSWTDVQRPGWAYVALVRSNSMNNRNGRLWVATVRERVVRFIQPNSGRLTIVPFRRTGPVIAIPCMMR